jgi:hypothetical protein
MWRLRFLQASYGFENLACHEGALDARLVHRKPQLGLVRLEAAENPPFRAPVFVLTHAGREPWVREGGTGTESLTDAYSLLDATPHGRQQDFEDSPAGWPQKPTYG